MVYGHQLRLIFCVGVSILISVNVFLVDALLLEEHFCPLCNIYSRCRKMEVYSNIQTFFMYVYWGLYPHD